MILKCDFLVFKVCCFQMQLVPLQRGAVERALGGGDWVGLYKLNPDDP